MQPTPNAAFYELPFPLSSLPDGELSDVADEAFASFVLRLSALPARDSYASGIAPVHTPQRSRLSLVSLVDSVRNARTNHNHPEWLRDPSGALPHDRLLHELVTPVITEMRGRFHDLPPLTGQLLQADGQNVQQLAAELLGITTYFDVAASYGEPTAKRYLELGDNISASTKPTRPPVARIPSFELLSEFQRRSEVFYEAFETLRRVTRTVVDPGDRLLTNAWTAVDRKFEVVLVNHRLAHEGLVEEVRHLLQITDAAHELLNEAEAQMAQVLGAYWVTPIGSPPPTPESIANLHDDPRFADAIAELNGITTLSEGRQPSETAPRFG